MDNLLGIADRAVRNRLNQAIWRRKGSILREKSYQAILKSLGFGYHKDSVKASSYTLPYQSSRSTHAAVVTALYVGRENGFSSIQVTAVEEFD